MPLHHENRKPNNLTSPIAPVRRCLNSRNSTPKDKDTVPATNCCWKVITRATAMWNVALSLLAVARKCSTIKFCPHARAVPVPCTVHVTHPHTQQTALSVSPCRRAYVSPPPKDHVTFFSFGFFLPNVGTFLCTYAPARTA